MKKKKDILTEAIQALYQTKVPAGPPKEIIQNELVRKSYLGQKFTEEELD